MAERDPFDTLRTLRDTAERNDGSPLGMTAHMIARHQLRFVDDVLPELDRLRHDRLVDIERDPQGSVWYTLSAQGEHDLARVEAEHAAARESADRLDL